ncbi:ribose-5-phosphate isomerase RpiA [Salibacterium aidingense]|uniref:ribose-5-phosphate isomerase RpiA n=1 Tax=Salibacterium aidingense TaxID=384933 RepID=UPI00040497C5|nr:ribose-5-phosphate isomerase RpiA [Salibacterium aidingense]
MGKQNHYTKLTTQRDVDKKRAAEKSVDFMEDGMTIGLGSGSTVYWMMKKLKEKMKQGLHITGVPSSTRTEKWAVEWQIPLTNFHEVQTIDVAIDGADEIDAHLNLLKGGGGSLVREKIVIQASKQVVIIGEQSKLVSRLGAAPLPVEVLPFGWEAVAAHISELGCIPDLRKKNGEVFVSDNGNYILDCPFHTIHDPKALDDKIKNIAGVVDTGLFVQAADTAIIGENNDVQILP